MARVSDDYLMIFGLVFVFRTARGRNQGTALSFVLPNELKLLEEIEKALSDALNDGGGVSTDTEKLSIFKPYQFRMDQIEGFRYRAHVCQSANTIVLGHGTVIDWLTDWSIDECIHLLVS